MLYAVSWFVVVALLALWSLLAWAAHGAAVWAMAHAGALSGAATAGWPWPDWLTPWLPAEWLQAMSALLSTLGTWTAQLLQALPSLAGAVTVLSWTVWGLGALALGLLGAGLHLLIGLARRASPPRAPGLAAG